jgi:hypothetical protein
MLSTSPSGGATPTDGPATIASVGLGKGTRALGHMKSYVAAHKNRKILICSWRD